MKKQFTLIALVFLLIAVTTTCKRDVQVTGIKLNERSLTLEVGDTATLVATVLPENATNQLVIFSSSNPLIAAVTSNGLVIAISKGIADIVVASIDGTFSTKCTVQVEECFFIEAIGAYGKENIATVYAIIDGKDDDKILVSTEFQDDSFKLKLPRTVDDKYLWLFADHWLIDLFDESWVSDKNAKITIARVNTWDENKNDIGFFYHHGTYIMNSHAQGFFLYADKNFTVKGEKNDEEGIPFKYDCSFSKGWNFLYLYCDHGYYPSIINYHLLTTQKPSGGFWNWLYIEKGEKKTPDNKCFITKK